MEKDRADAILNRVAWEFDVNRFHKYYYCAGLSLHALQAKLLQQHGQSARIMVRVDHIVVLDHNQDLFVYLLVGHESGRCADFLHQ